MGNVIAFILGVLSLIFVIPATIPFLGWGNWFALPLIITGVIVGQLSSSTSKAGRNFCLVILLVAVIRLSVGGGFF